MKGIRGDKQLIESIDFSKESKEENSSKTSEKF